MVTEVCGGLKQNDVVKKLVEDHEVLTKERVRRGDDRHRDGRAGAFEDVPC